MAQYHIFALTMNTLYQLLKDFDGTKAKSIDELMGGEKAQDPKPWRFSK